MNAVSVTRNASASITPRHILCSERTPVRVDTTIFPKQAEAVVTCEICGPILLRFGSFRQVLAATLFIDIEPTDGRHKVLLGYTPLKQAEAVVDLAEQRVN